MIKEKFIKINITSRNITFYKNLGYNFINGNSYEIKVEDINKNSKYKITAICKICGSENNITLEKYYKNKNNHNYYSCKKCSREKFRLTNNILFGTDNPMKNNDIKNKVENTNLEKYGVKTTLLSTNVKDKIKKFNLEKYGVESHLKSNEIRNKIKITNIEKYGFNSPIQNEKIKQKIKNTNFERYGFENAAQNEEIKLKIRKTNLERYGNVSPIKSEIVKNKLAEKFKKKYSNININSVDNKYLNIICKKCNHLYKISKAMFNHKLLQNIDLCPKCNPSYFSVKESQLLEFISNIYNGEIISNDKKVLSPYEIDIYLPELKIAFEYNGIYWHNELYKDDNYHLEKTELCESKGIQLIHIWEDNWLYKQDIVKSMILNKLGRTPNKIYARKCEIKEIDDNKLTSEFLEKNHIQGFLGSKIKIGLFFNNELVSLMTFGNRRIAMGKKSTNEGEYELLRFCNKLNTNIIGGASKLFKYFINKYNPKEIITYADRSFSQGKLYKTLGFKFIGKTQPNYYYVIGTNRYHRFNFRKNILIKDGFDSNKTEHEIMLERKIYRIYDSGNFKFSFLL